MPSRHDAAACLADIIENLERITAYVAGLDREQFAMNGLVRDVVERCLERVCEAAHRLGDQASELMPGQPWADIRVMGNRLRRAYDRISLDIVWNRLPTLEAAARQALAGTPTVSDDYGSSGCTDDDEHLPRAANH